MILTYFLSYILRRIILWQCHFLKGESDDTFCARRKFVARMLHSVTWKETFCTWRKTLLNIKVDDRWIKFRDTFREQRFTYKNLQLVVVRQLCTKHTPGACKNCSMPSRHMSCLTPTLYYFVMPISPNVCDKDSEETLKEFEPHEIDEQDFSEWSLRIPTIHVRA